MNSGTQSVMLVTKSHKPIGIHFAVILFLLTTTCSTNSSATRSAVQNPSPTKGSDQKTVRTFDCRNANEYRFAVVENPNRKKDSDPVTPEDVNIVVGDEAVWKIKLPKESEFKNISLDSIEKRDAGFELKVDWGSGLDHYEVQFNFRCKENNFYLFEVIKESLSTTSPNSGNFLDKKESKVTKIEPNLPIEKLVMADYL